MYQYSDTVLTFSIKGVDIQSITNPHITFKQEFGAVIDITEINIIDQHNFTVKLTQEQTAKFKEGTAEVQMNFFNSFGDRCPTVKSEIVIKDNLLKEVIQND